ncbi:MAG: metal ABC transporter substrate-binding protein [Gammaproteobacteria bacterium]|nr:metal ABC transporter substrate-binding protein [Gammaproteobacteria bacterium]
MKIIHIILVSLLLGMAFNSTSHAQLKVETTTQDLAAIAKAIGGKHIDVNSLTPGTRDPHFAVAKPSMIRRVNRADLLLVIGAELEAGWLPSLLQSARNSKIQAGQSGFLDLSQTIDLLGKHNVPVSRAMGDVHASGNPHYWLDPRNGIKIATAISQRLAQLDPANINDYQSNLKTFKAGLEKKYQQWLSELSYLKNQPVIAYHTSFIYLAHAFGFKIVDEVEPKPGISPSASSLGKLIRNIKQKKIILLIMEPYYEQRSVKYLKDKTGIRIAVLPQSVGAKEHIKYYFDLFDAIVKELNNKDSQ